MNNPTSEPIRLVVVGGGAGGTELAFSMSHRFKGMNIHLTIVQRPSSLLPDRNQILHSVVGRLLSEKGIEVVCDCDVFDVTESSHTLHGRRPNSEVVDIHYDECIWCTQASAAPWLKRTGLSLNEADGCICVNPFLESVSFQGVFAAGDVAHMGYDPRPKAGVFAVRQGPILYGNIVSLLLGKRETMIEYRPQSEFMSILGVGDGKAVSCRGPVVIEGDFVWQLKDKIDVVWMKSYQQLSMGNMGNSMTTSNETKMEQMRCGGCGSKVASSVLGRVLSRLPIPSHQVNDILTIHTGLSEPDDVAAIRISPTQLYLHTIDYFKSFIKDPYLFGQIASIHALSDVYAKNAQPTSVLALVQVESSRSSHLMESDLEHVMGGILSVLNQDNVDLIGGHTVEGDETCAGLSVNGIADVSGFLAKGSGNIAVGDFLVLTKPIGTGTIFAADMQGKGYGEWVSSAISNTMIISNKNAAAILYQYGCKCCTDVTGFGLAGHLIEMLKSSAKHSPISVQLNLAAIPVLAGAEECVEIAPSTLHPSNQEFGEKFVSAISIGISESSRYKLLFDPQTSGGLLAIVPHNDQTGMMMQALIGTGLEYATIIGQVVANIGEKTSHQAQLQIFVH